MTHGKAATYTNHGCRCEECKAAWAKYKQGYALKRNANGQCRSCGKPSNGHYRCLECNRRMAALQKEREAAR